MQAPSLLPECLNNRAVVQCHHCDLGHYGLVLEDGVERDVSQRAVPTTARRRTQARSAGNGSAATGTPGPQARLKAMMDIAVRAAARPGQRRLVLLWAVMAGIAAGLVIGLAARMARRIPGRRPICGVPARMDHRGAQTVWPLTGPASTA